MTSEGAKRLLDLVSSNGILVGYDNIIVDENILGLLREHGYDLEYARSCIEANKHNSITAAYFLKLKKHIASGGTSIANYGKPPIKKNTLMNFTVVPKPPLFKIEQAPPNRFRKYTEARQRRASRLSYSFRITDAIKDKRAVSTTANRRNLSFSRNRQEKTAGTPRPNNSRRLKPRILPTGFRKSPKRSYRTSSM